VKPVFLLQNAANPDIGGGLEIRPAHLLADEVLRLPNAGLGVDEQTTEVKAAMEKTAMAVSGAPWSMK
jgi:hypothetical protein